MSKTQEDYMADEIILLESQLKAANQETERLREVVEAGKALFDVRTDKVMTASSLTMAQYAYEEALANLEKVNE